jgi:hypothetical protein
MVLYLNIARYGISAVLHDLHNERNIPSEIRICEVGTKQRRQIDPKCIECCQSEGGLGESNTSGSCRHGKETEAAYLLTKTQGSRLPVGAGRTRSRSWREGTLNEVLETKTAN